jgi:hypothetical protein
MKSVNELLWKVEEENEVNFVINLEPYCNGTACCCCCGNVCNCKG